MDNTLYLRLVIDEGIIMTSFLYCSKVLAWYNW